MGRGQEQSRSRGRGHSGTTLALVYFWHSLVFLFQTTTTPKLELGAPPDEQVPCSHESCKTAVVKDQLIKKLFKQISVEDEAERVRDQST